MKLKVIPVVLKKCVFYTIFVQKLRVTTAYQEKMCSQLIIWILAEYNTCRVRREGVFYSIFVQKLRIIPVESGENVTSTHSLLCFIFFGIIWPIVEYLKMEFCPCIS